VKNPLTLNPAHPHGPDGYQLRLLVSHGDMKAAKKLLASLNHARKVFGQPPFEMPPPFQSDLPDLCACPAEQLVEVEQLETRDGWERRAA
jgi:hypothetical protein